MTKDTITIHNKDYEKVLRKVRDSIISVQNDITRSKVKMVWKIGRAIEQNCPRTTNKRFGRGVLGS